MTRPSPRHRPLLWAVLLIAALVLPVSGLAPIASAAEPAAPASAPSPTVHGLKGEYFRMSAPGARDFAELGGISLDPSIDFPGLAATFEAVTGRQENTTARWTGRIQAPATGDYTFYAIGDNGFRLFIDGAPVIDHWVPDWDKEQTSAVVKLTAGEPHDFRLEMFQDIGGANMFLRWSSPALAKQLVPESAFTPPAGFEVYPVALSVAADGLHVTATFDDKVTAVGAAKDHLKVEADTSPIPVKSLAVKRGDPRSLVATLTAPVQKDQKVRVAYDGTGGLKVGADTVPQIIRSAQNASTHRLTTTWGDQLDANHPLPEYPRPQQVREQWKNLNGPWQFAGATAGEQPVFGKNLSEKIIVPFPVESQLSGLERH